MHNGYHEHYCFNCHQNKPIPEHHAIANYWPPAYMDALSTYIGSNRYAQQVSIMVLRVRSGTTWRQQEVQVLAVQACTDCNSPLPNKTIFIPTVIIKGEVHQGTTYPESLPQFRRQFAKDFTVFFSALEEGILDVSLLQFSLATFG